MTFLKCSIYLQHFSGVTVAQNDCMPCKSSSLFLGLAVVRMKCFISCHRFSIGFKSGLSGGVFSTLILFAWKNLCVALDVWQGALSCWNLPFGSRSRRKGNKCVRSTSWYTALFTEQPRRQIFVAPFFDIPAHTMTLKGCFARGFGFGAEPTFQ